MSRTPHLSGPQRIHYHWMPDQRCQPTIRKYGLLYKLAKATVSKTGGVFATYELP